MTSIWEPEATSTSPGGQQLAPGPQYATLVAIIDTGTHERTFKGESRGAARYLYFVWELPQAPDPATGRPSLIGETFTLSLHKKSRLRKTIEAWFGKEIPEGHTLDLRKLLGRGCVLQLKGSEKGGYVHVDGVTPVFPPGTRLPAPSTPPVSWAIGDGPIPDWLARWDPYDYGRKVLDEIKTSPEWVQAGGSPPANGAGKPPAAPQQAQAPAPPAPAQRPPLPTASPEAAAAARAPQPAPVLTGTEKDTTPF